MNRKGILIGKILTSFPSLMLVFVIMFLSVSVSGIISVDSRFSEDLLGDFLSDYIILNGEVVTVDEAIGAMCSNKIIEDSLKIALREHFVEEYGGGNAFALVSRDSGGTGGFGYVLHSWSGAFIESINEKSPKILRGDFYKIFSLEKRKLFCSDSFELYVSSGGVNES